MGILIIKRSDSMNRYDQVRVDTQADALLKRLLDSMKGEGDINDYREWLDDPNEDFDGMYSFFFEK